MFSQFDTFNHSFFLIVISVSRVGTVQGLISDSQTGFRKKIVTMLQAFIILLFHRNQRKNLIVGKER